MTLTAKRIRRKSKTVKQISSRAEIHRLIAELVLGWRFHTHQTTSGIFVCNSKVTLDVWKDKTGEDAAIVADWSPTTNIYEAWRIVDKLHEQYWFELKSPFEPGEKWFAGFTERRASGWNGKPDFSATGDSAPHAICLAALAIFAGHECFEANEPVGQNQKF